MECCTKLEYINAYILCDITIWEGAIFLSPASEAQKRATMKYMKNNYDRIELKVPKGEKEDLKAHAQQRGESLNGFIKRAIAEALERDKAEQEDNA